MSKISTLNIYISEIKNNINLIKSKLEKNQKYCFVAKANCYGLGIKLCKFIDDEVDCYAVSSAGEFYKLKRYTKKEIIILDPVYENITKLAKSGVVFTVSNFDALSKIIRASKNKKLNFKVYIAVNTGMNRFGFNTWAEVSKVINQIKKTQNISILGVFSHIYDAKNRICVGVQKIKFDKILKQISKDYKGSLTYHLQATDATMLSKNHYSLVRIGLGNYTDKYFSSIKLTSKVVEIHKLKVGETAGYGGIFIAEKPSVLATIAIGYGDGLFRKIVGKGKVLIGGNYCKVVAVCMDAILVDVTNIKTKIGDEVTLIGRQGKNQIFICDLANWCDTIDYEIIVRLSSRIKRKYIEEKLCKSSQENIEQENLFQLTAPPPDQHLQE